MQNPEYYKEAAILRIREGKPEEAIKLLVCLINEVSQ